MTNTFKPTERQAMLIKMATSKKGTTRHDVRYALEYGEYAKVPVQAILKQIAERAGYELTSDIGDDRRAVYRMVKPTPKTTAKRPAKKAAKRSARKAA
jgi:hypothetical protein